MANQFDKFSKNLLGGTSLGVDAFDTSAAPNKNSNATKQPKNNQETTNEQPRNNQKTRKLISFNLDMDTINKIDDLHYKLRKPKQELYEEAFADLLAKYL